MQITLSLLLTTPHKYEQMENRDAKAFMDKSYVGFLMNESLI
jgi:hypothetical protein